MIADTSIISVQRGRQTQIVLPFKDDLPAHRFKECLDVFLPRFKDYLDRNIGKDNYNLLIVEEHAPETQTFNLGRTINIGFDLVRDQMEESDMFIFHPVDILPVDTDYGVTINTRFAMSDFYASVHDCPPELIIPKHKVLYGHYWYKAFSIRKSDFQKANGFSNDFVGWSAEDADFLYRLGVHDIDIDIVINNYGRLTHDGSNGDRDRNIEMALRFVRENNFLSGLATLRYELLSVTEEQGVNKYLVK